MVTGLICRTSLYREYGIKNEAKFESSYGICSRQSRIALAVSTWKWWYCHKRALPFPARAGISIQKPIILLGSSTFWFGGSCRRVETDLQYPRAEGATHDKYGHTNWRNGLYLRAATAMSPYWETEYGACGVFRIGDHLQNRKRRNGYLINEYYAVFRREAAKKFPSNLCPILCRKRLVEQLYCLCEVLHMM